MARSNRAVREDVLTQNQFSALLRRLDHEPEQAAHKYEEVRWKLVKFFQWNTCVHAEDLADEVLNRIARKLDTEAEVIQDLEAFAWGVARNLRLEARKKETRTIRLPDLDHDSAASDAGASITAIHQHIQSRQEVMCLHQCLQRLPATDRGLFLSYRVRPGLYAEQRKLLAQSLGITLGTLRVRVLRLREKMETCVGKCLGLNQIVSAEDKSAKPSHDN